MSNPSQALSTVLSPRLRVLLFLVFTLFALLTVNACYLGAITFLEWSSGEIYQDYFYQINFLLHLALGLALIMPFLWFGLAHLKRAWPRPNRRAVKAGLMLFICGVLLLLSGILLTRFDFFAIKHPLVRETSYWLHVITPFAAAALFVIHRLAGRAIAWHIATRWLGLALGFAGIMLLVHINQREVSAPVDPDAQPYAPAFSRTASGKTIPAYKLAMDGYCKECHADVHASWASSVHRLSSFNNPAYLASISETREALMARDGHTRGLRFCAVCHDPVPLFSGALETPGFDMKTDPLGDAGITCTACHAIESISGTRGNGDYVIAEPKHYPFTFSENATLRWLNRQLVKANPAFHNKTFLKPLHKQAEFCSVCHKVSIPQEVNAYKWLRGQNHYDAFLLSGVSGHGVSSFYYPPKAVKNCAECHMPLTASDDFGARPFDNEGTLQVHDHQFAAANTAVPLMVGMSDEGNDARREFLRDALRVDIFGIKQDGEIDAPMVAPLRPARPLLQAGKRYLLEVVIRTLRLGHTFTQGTADSNQVWLDVELTQQGKTIGRSGAMNPNDGHVDPWSHFVNAYVLDREGRRIDRRNAQDIFVTLYNNQIPPGAADVVHYAFEVPPDIQGEIEVKVALRYRKFDTFFMRYVLGDDQARNDLPVTLIAEDSIRLPVGEAADSGKINSPWPEWQRWNDYGIGLLRKGQGHQLRQAEQAFQQVERMGRAQGALNLARVYLKEGRLDDAVAALTRAAEHPEQDAPWTVTWFSGLVNKQNGELDAAIADFQRLAATEFPSARRRGFDFSRDYRVLNQLGQTLFERAKQFRGESQRTQREAQLLDAAGWFKRTLLIDVENLEAHYNLGLIYAFLGDTQNAAHHRRLHAKYKIDNNARDRAVNIHRKNNPAANHAAEAVVIRDLQRTGTYGLNVKVGAQSESRQTETNRPESNERETQ